MRITVKVKPNSRVDSVERISKTEFLARVKSPPHEGRANEAVIAALSDYFDIPKSLLSIVRGQTGRTKIIDISL